MDCIVECFIACTFIAGVGFFIPLKEAAEEARRGAPVPFGRWPSTAQRIVEFPRYMAQGTKGIGRLPMSGQNSFEREAKLHLQPSSHQG